MTMGSPRRRILVCGKKEMEKKEKATNLRKRGDTKKSKCLQGKEKEQQSLPEKTGPL